MIGSGLKKLAAEHGMRVSSGVAYGVFYGYNATFSEGSGYKQIFLSTRFPDPARKEQFLEYMGGYDLQKEYRVLELSCGEDYIHIRFHDNPGTMKKIIAFAQWFMPLLPEYGATGADICPECMQRFQTAGKWTLVGGAIAMHLHESCAERMLRNAEMEQEREKLEDTGSYLSGLGGALLGGALGSLVWGIVYALGYLAAIVGFLIGWLAEKGYKLLHGKKGKGKLPILLLASIFGVALGTLLGDVFTVATMVMNGELYGYVLSDVPAIMGILLADPEFTDVFVRDLLMGLLFALLGVFSILYRAHKETKPPQFKALD